MLFASSIIQTGFPSINLFDSAGLALQLMDDFDVQHLPVVNEEKYIGLISKDDLFDTDETAVIATLQDQIIKIGVNSNAVFLEAVKQIVEHETDLVIVVNDENEVEGVLTATHLLKQLALFNGIEEPGGTIVLELEKRSYAFGEISRLVETNDAYITQLNTTVNAETGMMQVLIKISKREVSDIVATFQRYDYHVKYYLGEEQYANELKQNFQHLLSYLNI